VDRKPGGSAAEEPRELFFDVLKRHFQFQMLICK
jgi:hypothetical protein